ncbi:MAG: MATE family efflux transporter, partial [Oscillospiraceae bacterium]|nr:MATE family efflux transporter [Oscillospiraceae bacterium]
MKTRSNEVDMVHGPLAGKIIVFALPLAASSVLQQLFNAADLAVVGRFANAEAMAAVGSNASVISLLISLFV